MAWTFNKEGVSVDFDGSVVLDERCNPCGLPFRTAANGRNAREQFAAACMGRTTTTFAQPAASQGPRASADADHLHRWQSQSLRAISAPEAPSRCALITSGRAIPPHLSRLGSGAQSRWHPSAAGRFCHAPLCHRAISCEFLKPGVRLTRTRRLPEAFDTSLPAIRE